MNALAVIGLLALGAVGGATLAVWIAWQIWRERFWRYDWERSISRVE